MKIRAHILLLGMLFLAVNPLIVASQTSGQQAETCSGSCCCDGQTEDMPDQKQDQEKDQDQGYPCDASCDCGCQFHLNAIEFQFNSGQLAEEQEYFFGSYHNEYQFEYFHRHIHPPRLA